MSAEPSPPADAAPRARRWRWRRLALVLLIGALLAAVLLSLAGWHVWSDRTAYARRLLNHYTPELAPELDALEISPGEIRVRGLQLRDPASGEVFGRVNEAALDHWLDLLRHRRFGRVRVDGLHLETNAERLPALLAALPRAAEAAETAVEPAPSGILPFSIEGVELNDLRLAFTGDERLPSVAFTLDHRLDGLRLESGAPKLAGASLSLRDVRIATPDGSTLRLDRLFVRLFFDSANGLLRVTEIALENPALDLQPGFAVWLDTFRGEPATEPAALPGWLRGIAIEKTALRGLKLQIAGSLPGLAAQRLQAELEHEAEDLLWLADNGLQKGGRHRLTLKQGRFEPADANAPGHLHLPELRAKLAHEDTTNTWHIDDLHLAAPDVEWTPEWEAALLPAQAKEPAPNTAAEPQTAPSIKLRQLVMSDARLKLAQTPRLPLDLQCQAELTLAELDWRQGKPASPELQRLRLSRIETQIPGSRTAAPTRIDAIEIELRPDAFWETGRIERLDIQKPQLAYHVNFDALAGSPPTPNAEPPAAPSLDLSPLLQKLHFHHLAITDGSVQLRGRFGAPFETETTFKLVTETAPGANASEHTLTIAETRLIATEHAPLPVARLGRFEARARLPDLLSERRVESLLVEGGQIEFGDALLSVLDSGSSAQPAPAPAPASAAEPVDQKKWHAGSVSVRDLNITLQRVAPGLPPFSFTTQFEAEDTPLEPEGLVENIEPQRVELSNLMIPSPYGLSRPVARLDTIFVHFTLDGLLRRRISKVEILHPTLYVGQPLFWYVDYYRNFAAGGARDGAGARQVALASATDDLALDVAAETVSGPPRQSWIVEELQVHSGKLVLAPKGVPLPGFRQPFPFSFTTRLESGQFEAVFDIPQDNYPLPDLKLEFIGMKGQVQFNLPMKEVDNNLTETFTVDQIRWKQLHVEKGHLSVTYDSNGIYGKFGGEAYEGYIEGGFDVYLNDSYTWDGWIAATGVRATEITEKLTPAYLLLDGQFNGTLIAAGDAKELYQADLDFTSTGSGNFSISGLDDMLNELPPPNTAALTDQFTRIGLETLRDFAYDTVHAKGRLHGREGAGFLNISGPLGSRNIEINVLDHRWKVDPPPEAEQSR